MLRRRFISVTPRAVHSAMIQFDRNYLWKSKFYYAATKGVSDICNISITSECL